jgi:hypothetical protein
MATAANGGTPYTITTSYNYYAIQGTFNADSTVTNQHGFFVASALTGATNNYGFTGQLASGTGRYNLYMSGTADNYLAGTLGIGTTSLGGGYALRVTKTFSADNGSGVFSTAIGSSSTPTGLFSMRSSVSTATNSGTPYTIGAVYSYYAVQGTFDADSTVTTQHGYYVGSSLTGATNNYAFTGLLTSGTGRYNLYMNGTAQNYIAGNVGIGSGKTVPAYAVDVTGTVAASTSVITPSVTNAGTLDLATTGANILTISTNSTERVRVTSAGGVSFGATGTAYGTSGQVLTSAGNAPPTWSTPSGGAGSNIFLANYFGGF